jgi:hypothetical protein
MAVRVLPVDVLPAEARVDLQVVPAVGAAAVRDPRRADATEDRVELVVADVEAEVISNRSRSAKSRVSVSLT